MRKKLLLVMLMLTLALTVTMTVPSSLWSITAEAHSGRTDGNGGHKDNKNKSGLGNYHYHCNGNPPHLHDGGVCPYSDSAPAADSKENKSSDSTPVSGSSKTESSTVKDKVTKDTIKKVQEKLNELEYNCGKADGILGSKTKTSIKKYQEDNNLTADGKITDDLLSALNIASQ